MDKISGIEKAQALGFTSIEECESHQKWLREYKAHTDLCIEAFRQGKHIPLWSPETNEPRI